MTDARSRRESGGTLAAFSLILTLAGCNSAAVERAPALAEAYVGPASLQLRAELVARAESTGTVKHGERVDIVGRRRRFVKVRTANDVEGWVDSLQLLDPQDMQTLQTLAQRAGELPGQGLATTFEVLNAHTAPNRHSPSFFQITPESRVEVITHQKAPRVDFEPPAFLADMANRAKKAREERQKSRKKKVPLIPPPPRGPAPAVPRNWIAISGYPDGPPPPPVKPPPPPAVMDWWSLVKTKDGLTGWALTRMLYMAIPEDVAQYAERARITSYFSLGPARATDKGPRSNWLWTTLKTSGDYHFDNLRVFHWNTRRERYETAYIERDVKGWLPVVLKKDHGGHVTGWSVVVEEKDGSVQERDYSWSGDRARIVSRRPAKPPKPWYDTPGARGIDPDADSADTNDAAPDWRNRVQGWWRDVITRVRK